MIIYVLPFVYIMEKNIGTVNSEDSFGIIMVRSESGWKPFFKSVIYR